MQDLCTYFDVNYLCQALALYRSLERQGESFTLWMLCFDRRSKEILLSLDLPHAVVLDEEDLLQWRPSLRRSQQDRGRIEFYYACTPALIEFVFEKAKPRSVAYVDADMLFFQAYSDTWPEFVGNDCCIIEHNSGDAAAEAEHGIYNVSLMLFTDTPQGRACLSWWAERCAERTGFGDGIWGDQKYLDQFSGRFPGVKSSASPSIALAPWNAWRFDIDHRDGLSADGRPVRVYHYARFLMVNERVFIPVRRDYLPRQALDHLYRPYMDAMRAARLEVQSVDPGFRVGYSRRNLRGLLLGLLLGRAFLHGKVRVFRLGLWLPSSWTELRQAFSRSRRHKRRLRMNAAGATGNSRIPPQ